MRALSSWFALVAMALALFGGLPGPHWCALAEQAARSVADDDHACCPDKASAADDGPILCDGDCCGSDGPWATVATPEVPLTPVSSELPRPEALASPVPTARARRLLASTRPRGPPPRPPRAPPWLRHASMLL